MINWFSLKARVWRINACFDSSSANITD
jgi:hypothetical protein